MDEKIIKRLEIAQDKFIEIHDTREHTCQEDLDYDFIQECLPKVFTYLNLKRLEEIERRLYDGAADK